VQLQRLAGYRKIRPKYWSKYWSNTGQILPQDEPTGAGDHGAGPFLTKWSNIHLNYFITEYNVEGFSSLPSNKVKEKAERLKVIKTYLSDEELKNINYLLVDKKETLFMRVFKRFKKIIESNGYKS
jgi:hypothetical protein